MDDILAGKASTDKVIYNDKDPETGFVLLVDSRWTEEKMEDLLILAIVRKNGILCLREVNASHLALLENVYEQGKVCVCVCVHIHVCVHVCMCCCVCMRVSVCVMYALVHN